MSRGFKNYRKRFTAKLTKLKFLDDRAVFDKERRLAEAWASGGIERENEEKQKLFEEREQQNRKTF